MLEKFLKGAQSQQEGIQRPAYGEMKERVSAICYGTSQGTQWYPPLMISADAIAESALRPENVEAAIRLTQSLEMDDYCRYLAGYYREGLQRFGPDWRYADIVTVLIELAARLKPTKYLEIGVRRGRSVCAVASRAPTCDLYMFDMWVSDYAGMDNPGPVLVSAELDKVGHSGVRKFTDGNSHETLKRFFDANPESAFDLITVDGDHSFGGAAEDLCDVLPRLKIGGAVVFDDICHPKHLYLQQVWQQLVVNDPRFSSWTCSDIGYGVGFALRKW
jgi:predicted O-methyltransferase YrrM